MKIQITKIGFVALFLFAAVSVFGQRKAPGYMGKRFVLMYEQGISWSFGKTIRGVPNFFYTLQGDVAVTKKYSLGGEYSFRTRNYGPKFDKYEIGEQTQLQRSMVHKVGFYAKMFSQRNGHLAPAGPYFLAGINFFFIDSKYLTKQSDGGTGKYDIPDRHLTFDFTPVIGGGKQYIVGNRFVLDVSMRVSLPFVAIVRNFRYTINGSESDEQQRYNGAKAFRAAMPNFEANILELRFGFGGVL